MIVRSGRPRSFTSDRILTRPPGAGAGQAIEDGHILGRALHDCFAPAESLNVRPDLEAWTRLYHAVRFPRAQKAQRTAREAGDVYEMNAHGMKGLSFEQCLSIVIQRLKDRMRWIWTEDIDAAYEGLKQSMSAGLNLNA